MDIDSVVLGDTMKVNKVEPLNNTITISNIDIDRQSISNNIDKIIDKNNFYLDTQSNLNVNLNDIKIDTINLKTHIIDNIHLKSKPIIDKIHLKSNSIELHHLCSNIIENKHLKNNSITSRNIVNNSITFQHIANNTIKLQNIDHNIGYIFNNFTLENGINRLNINELGITNSTDVKPLWLIQINNTTNNLEFLQLNTQNEYIKRHEITYINQ